MTTEQRHKVVIEAYTWLGTPYRGWSRVKGPRGGVDCGQLLAGVYIGAGVLPPDIDLRLPKYYSLSVAQHQESTEYLEIIGTYMREIPEAEVKAGDVVVYKLGLAFAHAAIVVEWPRFVIHSFANSGVSGATGDKHPRLLRAARMFFTLREECIPA